MTRLHLRVWWTHPAAELLARHLTWGLPVALLVAALEF